MINMPGGPEVLVIFLVALIVLGPQQLPKAMRTFGNVMAEIRKVSSSFQAEMRTAMDSVVDTTAAEKPKSGFMADATPTPAPKPEGAPAESSDPVDEVVARNDAATLDAFAAESGTETAAAAEPDEPARPAIDPADRAAG